ncbi:hypothetical protein [Actinomadura parmotrematis]|uniref:DUF4352 domain-containing protein n=1 Tax=Actinomadura parmotrematis TaxID=2864039 RepID=A0ABS7FT37_9ACTN|nr:hypothetical protein [Actinomadura parmotrematis]MBW8483572.1 hypothetical protein [Actinomadura parmotrematis]
MSNHHRSAGRRRRKQGGAGRLGLAGALAGAVGIAAVAGAIVVLRPDSQDGGDRSALAGQGDASTSANAPGATQAPKSGTPLSFNTPEGYGYTLAAVKAGTDPHPLKTSKASPAGDTFAYVDYVLTNTLKRPVPLEYPGDLFVPASEVPAAARSRCMPQPGTPAQMCTLPNHSKVTARIGGAKAPFDQDGDTMMPAGASYIVRVATDLPVKDSLQDGDVRLYVWDARYVSDRKAVRLDLP